MKAPIIFTLLIIACINSYAQQELPKAFVNMQLYINGKLQVNEISKQDMVKYGVQLICENPAFKVKGFGLCVPCRSTVTFYPDCEDFEGNQVKAGDRLLRGFIVGDVAIFEGIVLENNKKQYSVRGIGYRIIE